MSTTRRPTGTRRRGRSGSEPSSVVSPTIDQVVRAAPCDIAVVKQRGSTEIRRILVPVRGGPHAELALTFADALGTYHGATVTVLHVVPAGITRAVRAQAERALAAFVKQHVQGAAEPLVREAANVRTAILREAERADVVVVGASASPAEGGARGAPVRRPARGDRHPRPADRRRGQDPRDDRPEDVREAGRAGRDAGRGRSGGRGEPGRSRPGSSAGSANQTSTMPSSPTCVGWSSSRRSRA